MNKIVIIAVVAAVVVAVIWGIYGLLAAFNKSASPSSSGDIQKQGDGSNQSVFEIEGMKVEVLKQGSGTEAKNGDNTTVHYTGTFQNGQKFDSSVDRGTPFTFQVGAKKVIRGWDLGIAGMKVGEKRKLTIPPALAYGSSGILDRIPPDATLIFEVELLKIGNSR